jgi:hypothetical protein
LVQSAAVEEEQNNAVGVATLKEKKSFNKSRNDRLQKTTDCRSSQHAGEDVA